MNCDEFIERLQAEMDGPAVPVDSAFEGHKRACAACAELHAAMGRMFAGLRSRPAIVPPDGLASRITIAVRRDTRLRRLARRGGLALATAAAVLVVVGVRFFTASSHHVPGGIASAPPKVELRAAPLSKTVAEAGEAVASLTSRTADEAVGQTRLLLPSMPRSAFSDLDLLPSNAPAKPLREAGENVSAGLDPITTSARRAVDLFLRDIPPLGSDNRRGL
jgi:anti-sigma factor RsiW